MPPTSTPFTYVISESSIGPKDNILAFFAMPTGIITSFLNQITPSTSNPASSIYWGISMVSQLLSSKDAALKSLTSSDGFL